MVHLDRSSSGQWRVRRLSAWRALDSPLHGVFFSCVLRSTQKFESVPRRREPGGSLRTGSEVIYLCQTKQATPAGRLDQCRQQVDPRIGGRF